MEEITLGNLTIDFENYAVYLDGRFVDLSVREFEVLRVLVENRDHILTYERFTEFLWQATDRRRRRNLNVLIHRLRAKLVHSYPYVIRTLRSRGYGLIRQDAGAAGRDLAWRAG